MCLYLVAVTLAASRARFVPQKRLPHSVRYFGEELADSNCALTFDQAPILLLALITIATHISYRQGYRPARCVMLSFTTLFIFAAPLFLTDFILNIPLSTMESKSVQQPSAL
jgi:hypothetical protein